MAVAIPIVVAFIVTLALSIIFKDQAKKDKGFSFIYFKLSYRRKMIRTITILPLLLALFIVLYYVANWDVSLVILFGLFYFLFKLRTTTSCGKNMKNNFEKVIDYGC